MCVCSAPVEQQPPVYRDDRQGAQLEREDLRRGEALVALPHPDDYDDAHRHGERAAEPEEPVRGLGAAQSTLGDRMGKCRGNAFRVISG
jgi:hypothetical protein